MLLPPPNAVFMPKVNTQLPFARYFSASSFWISACGTLARPGCRTSMICGKHGA